jgi:hypothetical protein
MTVEDAVRMEGRVYDLALVLGAEALAEHALFRSLADKVCAAVQYILTDNRADIWEQCGYAKQVEVLKVEGDCYYLFRKGA